MREKLLTYLARNPRSSFSEIEALFERADYDYKGESAMVDPSSNILFWAGWSREAFDLVYGLVKDRKIVFSPATWVERMCFGVSYDLPIAKRMRHRYKRMHWLPVVASAVESGDEVP